jgi:DGQHR domain-containing protein
MATYHALRFSQRTNGPVFCLFHASASEILEWADIDRLAPTNQTGIQRPSKSYKVAAIKSFFNVDPANTIPTAVVIAIQGATLGGPPAADTPGAGSDAVTITIPTTGAQKAGLVIDGQHRLLGIQAFDGNLHIPVVGILDADDAEKAFQFVVINNKASKVAPDHIKALRLTYDAGEVSKRLEKVRLQIGSALSSVKVADTAENSPFKGMVDWELNEKGARKIQPTAIEAAVTHIMQHGGKGLEEKDLAEEFFFLMWTTVKETYKDAWAADLDKSALCRKVGIICLTAFLTDNLVSYNRVVPTPIDLTDADIVKPIVSSVLKFVPEQFWTTPWSSKSYDTAAGRTLIIRALAEVADNMRAGLDWKAEVQLIDAAGNPDMPAS